MHSVILVAYVLVFLFDKIITVLQLRHVKRSGTTQKQYRPEIPIEGELLQKTALYTAEKLKLKISESTCDFIIMFVFLFGGILKYYNSWVINAFMAKYGFVLTGIIFFFILSLISSLIGIPFSIYEDFVIEKRFGFNTKTLKLWIRDFVVSSLISVILFFILSSIALSVVKASPDLWWFWCWLITLIFGIIITIISPYVIEPLFNKYAKLENSDLEQKLRDVIYKMGLKADKILVVDASKRSKHSNAYFAGFWRVKRIVLFDTLLSIMNDDEIVAVVSHEAGHWKKKHILKTFIYFEIIAIIISYISYLFIKNKYFSNVFGIRDPSFFTEVFLIGFVLGLIAFPFAPLRNWLARKMEKEADIFACHAIGSGKTLASALIKLHKENLAQPQPHPVYAWFHYSHPPLIHRIDYLLKFNENK